MNWFIVALVFHVLRVNLCVALSQGCAENQFLNASGVCVNCTICKHPDKNVLQPCSTRADTLCGSVSFINVDLPGVKIEQSKNDLINQVLTVNTETKLSKKNITNILKKLAEQAQSKSSDKTSFEDDDIDEDYTNYEDDDSSTTTSIKKISKAIVATAQKKKKSKKESNNKQDYPVKYSVFPNSPTDDGITVVDPDILLRNDKISKKSKPKKKDAIAVNDLSLKIGDTKFEIGDEKSDDGRWLKLSHPHIVNKKIFVDLVENPVDKKGSTFFSSSEKRIDQEYANEMTKLLNETSSVLNKKTITNENSTKPGNGEDVNGMLKNLDDIDDDDDDDDDDDEDDEDSEEDDDEDDGDDDIDDKDDGDNGIEDDDYMFYRNAISNTPSEIGAPKEIYLKSEKEDEDLDKLYGDIFRRPLAESSASWEILILVAAMSACLLFFIVVTAYICIYMRKSQNFKTTFQPDIEDLSVRVNLMQHGGFEVEDSNIKNYITQLRGVKSNDEKLPKIFPRNK